jgi:hypothetical protein
MKSEPKVGDIIKYHSSYFGEEEHYGIIAKLPYGELVHIEWFNPTDNELIGNKISVWGYGELWKIAN